MSMPRNNLDDVLRKRPPTSSSNSSSAVTGAGATAAKVRTSDNSHESAI